MAIDNPIENQGRPNRRIDLVGRRFGKLIVLALLPGIRKRGHRPRWECRFDCGKTTSAQGGHLRYGHTTSCGCVRAKNSTTHGMKDARTYKIWKGMRQRCLNPNNRSFQHYGGRGITICQRWDSFENFLEDMGHCPVGLTIERKNNNLGYSPSNCCWATFKEQAANRRIARDSGGVFRSLEECA